MLNIQYRTSVFTYKPGCNFHPMINTAATSRDTAPPVITGCPGATTVMVLGATSGIVTWTEPTATDDSGAAPTVAQSHRPGDSFPAGSTQVQYTFTDQSSNSATCLFPVTGKTKYLHKY